MPTLHIQGDELQRVQAELRRQVHPSIVIAADHLGHCRCSHCLFYWASFNYGEDPDTGPFSQEEIDEYKAREDQG